MAKTAAVKASKKPLKKRIWDQRYLFLLMVPAIIWVAVICYAPMTGLYMAFTNYAPSTKGYFHDLLSAPFVGLEWFQYFFENDFKMIMRNTMATSLLTLLFSFPAPIIIAILLTEHKGEKVRADRILPALLYFLGYRIQYFPDLPLRRWSHQQNSACPPCDGRANPFLPERSLLLVDHRPGKHLEEYGLQCYYLSGSYFWY